jgi:hypothetical protein
VSIDTPDQCRRRKFFSSGASRALLPQALHFFA